jgi:hypothetical protein
MDGKAFVSLYFTVLALLSVENGEIISLFLPIAPMNGALSRA